MFTGANKTGLLSTVEMEAEASIIAYVWFTDGVKRPVYQEPDGRQFVIDGDGDKVYGVWYIPEEERIGPDAIVESP